MVIEILAHAGIDFVIIDMEHCPMDMDRLAHLIRAADAAGIAPLVRVPEVDAGLIKRVLNLDVAGIVIPHGNRQSCEALVRAVRYPPDGKRGACPIVRATGYWPDDWSAFFSNRPVGVKHFQTIHHCSVDVAHGLALLFGIGTMALPLWDPRTRRNNLTGGLAVSVTAGPSGHTNSPHPSSREGHLSTAGWISVFSYWI